MSCNCNVCPNVPKIPNCRGYGSNCVQIVESSFSSLNASTREDFYRNYVFDTYWSVDLSLGGFLTLAVIPTTQLGSIAYTDVGSYGYMGFIMGGNSYDYMNNLCYQSPPFPAGGGQHPAINAVMGTVVASDMPSVCQYAALQGSTFTCTALSIFPFSINGPFDSYSVGSSWSTYYAYVGLKDSPFPTNLAHPSFDCFLDQHFASNCYDLFLEIGGFAAHTVKTGANSGRREAHSWGATYGTYLLGNARAPDELTLFKVVQPSMQRFYMLPATSSETLEKSIADFNSLPDTITINRV